MPTCANFSEQLLDFLYGLLDEDETVRLRLHLQACPQCQAQLREAEGQQRLISQAARACKGVAAYTAPGLDVPLDEPAVVPMAVPQAAAGPQTPRAPGKTFPRWLRYGSVALAASVLLGIVAAREIYHSGLNGRAEQVADLKKQIDIVDGKYRQASSRFEQDKKLAVQPSDVVQLNLTGTPQFDPNAGAAYNVLANNLNGNLQNARLDVRVVDAESHKVLFQEAAFCRGDSTKITVPPGLKSKEMQLVVVPQTVPASPPLVANLRAAEPVYVTHLALNKAYYYPRELLFFRTVTLEQFSLRPIAAEVALRFSLVGSDGKIVKQLQGKTGPGGIAGGELALSDDVPPGSYFLEVAPVAGGDGIRRQRRRVDILGAGTLQVVMNQWKTDAHGKKSAYAAGDWAEGKLVGPDSAPIADQRIVPDIVQPSGGRAEAPAAQQMPRTYSDNQGNFRVAVPGNLEASRAQLNLGIPTRTSFDNVTTTINVVPAKVIVDFCPEGGDLIEGVRTKVYYRVRSLQGDPVIPDGRVIVKSTAGAVLHESETGQAAGFFFLMPERFEVRLSSPRTEVANAHPFDEPPADLRGVVKKLILQTQGLALSVPGVTPANEAIKAQLFNKGEAKRLLVLVACRGQIVEQQILNVNEAKGAAEAVTLELKPMGDVAGIMRVTVCEITHQTVVPLAERLVFRMPAHRLELAGSLAIHPGRNSLTATWNDEAKKPVACYASAAVIDAQFAGDNDRDLPAHFYLDSDVASPADLENANVLVGNNPERWRALDLFLGTQGWRRFVAGPDRRGEAPLDQEQLARDEAKKEQPRLQARELAGAAVPKAAAEFERLGGGAAAVVAGPTLVSLENASLTQLQARDQDRIDRTLTGLRNFLAVETADLAQQRADLLAVHGRLSRELADYQRLPEEVLATVLRSLLLLALGIGVVLMLAGFNRLARRRQAALMFAGSFASLGACMVLMMSAGRFGAERADDRNQAKLDVPAWPVPPPLDGERRKLAAATNLLGPGRHPVQLAAAMPQPKNDARGGLGGGIRDRDRAPAAKKSADFAPLYEQMISARNGFPNQMTQQNQAFGNSARFDQALRQELAQDKGLQALEKEMKANAAEARPAAPAAPPGGGAGGPIIKDAMKSKGKKLDGKELAHAERAREYALMLSSPQDRCDPMLSYPATILWVPALEAKNDAIQLNFDLPEVPQSRYRVIIEAHTDDGRLGSFMETLTPGAAPAQAK